MKSPQQLSQEIIDIIKATGNYFVGNTSGMSNDGTVNVYHPKGYSVSAIAANPISSGEVIVFNVNGTWYAFGEQRTVVKEDILVLRKSRARDENYSVKTIFAISGNDILKVYLGGDRTSKQLRKVEGYENTRFISSYSYATILNLGGDKLFTALDVATPSTDFTKSLKKNSSRYIDFVDTSYGAYDKLYLGHNYFESLDNYYDNYYDNVGHRVIYQNTNKYVLEFQQTRNERIKTSDNKNTNYYYNDFEIKTLRRDNSEEIITLTRTANLIEEEFSVGAIIAYVNQSAYKFDHAYTFTTPTTCYWYFEYENRLVEGMTLTYDLGKTAVGTLTPGTITTVQVSQTSDNSIVLTGGGFATDPSYNGIDIRTSTVNFTNWKTSLDAGNTNTVAYSITNTSSGSGGFEGNATSEGTTIYYVRHPFDFNNTESTTETGIPYVTYGLRRRRELCQEINYYFNSNTFIPNGNLFAAQNPHAWLVNPALTPSTLNTGTLVFSEDKNNFTVNYQRVEAGLTLERFSGGIVFCIAGNATASNSTVIKGDFVEVAKVLVPTTVKIRDTVEGKAVAVFTADGEIVQDYKAYFEYDNGYTVIDDPEYGKYLRNKYTTAKLEDEKNILTLRYGNIETPTEIVLNTNDFGIIRVDNVEKVTVSTIAADTETFTITISDPNTKYIKNITGALFNPASFNGQDYLFAYDIADKPALIRGNISNASYNTDTFVFTLTCDVTNIKLNTPTSFYKSLILDNGSFYNYYFRKTIPLSKLPYNTWNNSKPFFVYQSLSSGSGVKDFGLFMNKSVIPIIPLNPSYASLWVSTDNIANYYYNFLVELKNYYSEIHKTDNIIKNKIFSVVKIENNKAWVEQWDIKENGDVKYSKVFQVDYVPIKKANVDETLTIYGHSYYPK